MKRNLLKFSENTYDIAIIGAGIYGACTAWEATLRGLRVALLDKGDFGSATSSNSLKIIHGGLRYLQNLDFKRMRESIRERKIMMRIAPHLVHPIPVIMPTYGHLMKGKEMMSIALLLNDIISFDRNRLDDPQKHIPRGKIISKTECLQELPYIDEKGLTGAAIWHDAQVYNSERLILSFIQSAEMAGADIANYVQVTGFLGNSNEVNGVKAKDMLTGKEIRIRAKLVVNTSGPWVNNILNILDNNSNKIPYCKAINLVTKRQLFKKYAVGLDPRNNEVAGKDFGTIFITPWRNHSIIGISYGPYNGNRNELKVSEEEIDDFIEYINAVHPSASLKREDISFVHKGLLPMTEGNNQVNLLKHYKIIDNGIKGMISVIGVKYTTARDVAKKVIDIAFNKLEKELQESKSAVMPLYGGDIKHFDDFLADVKDKRPNGLDSDIVEHLIYNYGSKYTEVIKLLDKYPQLGRLVSKSSKVIKAEIIYGIREEMAQKLSDIVLRRTELGSAGHPGEECLKTCAETMAEELGWDRERMDKELEEVKKVYEVEYS